MPVLLMLKGQPGSGKSTLAAALARRLRWPIVSKDAGRDPLQEASQRAPQLDWNALSYDIMWSFCEAQLQADLNVIVDSPLARRELFLAAERLAQKHGASMALVECCVGDDGVWRRRLEERGLRDAGTPREHKPGSWEAAQHVLRRNAGSEAWSLDVTLPCRVEVETTTGTAAQQADIVCQALLVAGLLPPEEIHKRR